MISAELSSIWGSISLPQLLQREKTLFDAHLRLRKNEPDEKTAFSWLTLPDSVTAKKLHAIRKAADEIRANGEILVIVGSGTAFLAAKAAVSFLQAQKTPDECVRQLLFFSGDLSSRSWLSLCKKLDGRDFSLHLIMPHGTETEAAVASRGVRWLLERRYGSESKRHVFVSTLPDSPIAQMAQEGGFTLLGLPEAPCGDWSSLTSAVLLPVCAAGFDPLCILDGAVNAWQELDVRAFENPLWMYAGARHTLEASGRKAELFCCLEPSQRALCDWWQELMLRRSCGGGRGLLPMTALLPRQLEALSASVGSGGFPLFQTFVRFSGAQARKVGVEMDWKDYDGLGYLAGKTLDEIAEAEFSAMCAVQEENGVPMLTLECDGTDEYHLGEFFYFMELSALLCAAADGVDADDGAHGRVWDTAAGLLGRA